jgi:hypothetical protein
MESPEVELPSLNESPLSQVEREGSGLPSRGKPSPKYPLGREVFDRKGFAQYQAQPLESKREILRKQWADLAYLLLSKATSFAATVTKKDYGRLVQILTSAGISMDKVFPKDLPSSVNNLVVNMFKGLPNERVLRVIGSAPLPSQEPLRDNPSADTLPGNT